MTELEQLRAGRDDVLVERLARRAEPTIGFVIFGFVWLLVGSFAGLAGGFVAAVVMHALGAAANSSATTTVALVATLATWALTWIPWARWAKRKRAAARTLVREGALCDAVAETTAGDRAVQLAAKLALSMSGAATRVTWSRVVFEHAGTRYSGLAPFDGPAADGTRSCVLFHPSTDYALAFSSTGQAIVTKPAEQLR